MTARRFAPRPRRVFLAVLLGCSLLYIGCDELKAMRERTITLTSPKDGPASGAKRGKHIVIETPGKILPEYFTRSEWTTGGQKSRATRHSRGVVALVASDWKPGQPIPMWVSGASLSHSSQKWDELKAKRESEERRWAEVLGAALAKGPIRGKVTQVAGTNSNSSAEHEAIAQAEAAHGIKSFPGAPVISWQPKHW